MRYIRANSMHRGVEFVFFDGESCKKKVLFLYKLNGL